LSVCGGKAVEQDRGSRGSAFANIARHDQRLDVIRRAVDVDVHETAAIFNHSSDDLHCVILDDGRRVTEEMEEPGRLTQSRVLAAVQAKLTSAATIPEAPA